MKNTQNIKIFSYGTLQKSKFSRDRETQRGTLTGSYEIIDSPSPLLVELNKGNFIIKGTLFKVSQEEINEIDEYEGLPHLFKREQKTVVLDDGTKEKAWVYLLNQSV